MTYRVSEFNVNNSGGVGLDIFIDPETLDDGTVFFVIEQDTERVTVSLECLENLLDCANQLLKEYRDSRDDGPLVLPLAECCQRCLRDGIMERESECKTHGARETK